MYTGVLLLFALAVASYFVYQFGQVVVALPLTLPFAVIFSGLVDICPRGALPAGGRRPGSL